VPRREYNADADALSNQAIDDGDFLTVQLGSTLLRLL
jgi:hypothetical protein